MNSKKLLRKFEYSKSRDTKNFQHCSCDPCKGRAQRSWPLFSFLERQRFHTHTFNNKRQNCMECKFNGSTSWARVAIAYLTILPPLPPDKDQNSVIFGSEKDQ